MVLNEFFCCREMPTNHQEWLELLQKQEALHRFELQTWHDILLSALKILKQAETDLESLKFHVDSYSHNRIYDSSLKSDKLENPKPGAIEETQDSTKEEVSVGA